MKLRNVFTHCFASHIIIVLSASYLIRYVNGQRRNPQAVAYETASKDGKFAEYNDDPFLWSNMKTVLKHNGMKTFGQLCITGVYLLYARNNYQSDSEKGIKMLSGIDVCAAPGMARSVQLAASYRPVTERSFVVFKDTIIRGSAFAVSRNMFDFDSRFGGVANSLLIKGDSPYTVLSSKGIKYCFKPDGPSLSKDSICLLLDFKNTAVEKDKIWVSIFRNCDATSQVNTIRLTNCYEFGGGDPVDIKPDDDRVRPDDKTDNDDTNGPSPIQGCDDNEELVDLLAFRMNNDFSSHYQMRFPTDKEHVWRTDLLDSAFDIAIGTCPPELVNHEFLQIIRELYIYLAEKMVWKEGKGWPANKTESKEVTSLMELATICAESVEDPETVNTVQEMTLENVEGMDEPNFSKDSYKPEFERMNDLDEIMEIVWLIYNHAASFCHFNFQNSENFWPDFALIFSDMYLEPMKDYWKSPGKFRKNYQVLLSGFDMMKQYKGLAICSSNAFFLRPSLEVLPRPEGLPELPKSNNVDII